MTYKVNKEFLNRWFSDGMREIAMTNKTSQEDLEYIFGNQKYEYVLKEVSKSKKSKNK